MGSIGGQPGNNNAGRGQLARQALEIAVRRMEAGETGPVAEKITALVEIWETAIRKAKGEGDIPALNAIMDRLDGKPGQAINVDGKLGVIQLTHDEWLNSLDD